MYYNSPCGGALSRRLCEGRRLAGFVTRRSAKHQCKQCVYTISTLCQPERILSAGSELNEVPLLTAREAFFHDSPSPLANELRKAHAPCSKDKPARDCVYDFQNFSFFLGHIHVLIQTSSASLQPPCFDDKKFTTNHLQDLRIRVRVHERTRFAVTTSHPTYRHAYTQAAGSRSTRAMYACPRLHTQATNWSPKSVRLDSKLTSHLSPALVQGLAYVHMRTGDVSHDIIMHP